MNHKALKIFIYLALFLLFLSTAIFFNSRTNLKDTSQEILLEDFDNILKQINKIKFYSNEHSTTIERNDDGWVLSSHDNFPANAGELRKFFYNLREAKVVALKTAKKDRHYKLGLGEDSKITLLLNNNDQELAAFDLGVYNYLVGGTYVKEKDNAQSFLVSSNLGTDSEGFHWMSPYLFNIGPEVVKKVTISQPFKRKKIFSYDENRAFTLISPVEKSADEFISNDVKGNLQDVELEGYILKDNLKNISPKLKAEYQFINKSSLMINYYNLEDEIFITLDFKNIPNGLLPLQKQISEDFIGNQFEISSNAILNYGFQVNKMKLDNLDIELD